MKIRIWKLLLITFLVLISITSISTLTKAESRNVNIVNTINKSLFQNTEISLEIYNEVKNKTIPDFTIILPEDIKILSITSDNEELQYSNIGNSYKILFPNQISYQNQKKIQITYESTEKIKKIGKLYEIQIPEYNFSLNSNVLVVDTSFGEIIYNSCNCEVVEGESISTLQLQNKAARVMVGSFQIFEMNFTLPGINTERVQILLPDNDTNSLIYYDKSSTQPNKLFKNNLHNLFAEFNKVSELKLKSYILRKFIDKNIFSAEISNLYTEFVSNHSCKSNLSTCSNFEITKEFNDLLLNSNVNSKIVVGYQNSFYTKFNKLSYWIEISDFEKTQTIDPYLEIITGEDFFFQNDLNRFKIYNYPQEDSIFKNGINLPKNMTIFTSTESVPINENILDSKIIVKKNFSEKFPENQFLLFTNNSSQIVSIKDINFLPVNILRIDDDLEIYIFPGNSYEIDLGNFLSEITGASSVGFKYKFGNEWVDGNFEITADSQFSKEKQTYITIFGYLGIIAIFIILGLWVVIKKQE
jgi:hypothetical protein